MGVLSDIIIVVFCDDADGCGASVVWCGVTNEDTACLKVGGGTKLRWDDIEDCGCDSIWYF